MADPVLPPLPDHERRLSQFWMKLHCLALGPAPPADAAVPLQEHEDMINVDFKSPDALVTELQKAAESIFSAVMGKDALKLLDIGAGTGLVGQKLAARGFTNLEAIDLSPKMLAIDEKKNLYQKTGVRFSFYNWRKHFDVGQFDIA
ncbi:ubiE/COQ5 methyltransferase [Desmophyllum pertusum]|uniref:UbiE/COQ5 methyltransferase n=1 Tax=Desmophyllum pertusum TaxID=174260 RepID=A0A9W9Y852_9CNID|nr:ubiE/COQ5 methyltransferase [Desmophyllum pertusum]